MAHLWHKLEEPADGTRKGDDERWVQQALPDDQGLAPVPLGPALLLRTPKTAGGTWYLLCPPRSATVNGVSVALGIHALTDRDMISTVGIQVFFATDRPARVEPCPEGTHPLRCPRCQEAVPVGSLAVRCPQCGVWHHQSDEYPCWTYSEHCTLCPQPTALDGALRWTPEELGA